MSDRNFDLAVSLIYRAALDPLVWPDALDAIARCTGDDATVLLYGREDGGFGVIESPSIKSLVQEYLNDGWNFRDIRANRCRERGYFLNRDVVTDRDILSEAEMRIDPFYAELLHKYGFKYFAAAMVKPNKSVEVALSVQRKVGRPPYSEEEIRVVSRLGAHVEQSLRLGMQLIDTTVINDGLSKALTRMGVGVFVLDSLGHVMFSNEAAARQSNAIEIANGRLAVSNATSHRELSATVDELISFADYDVLPKAMLVPRAGSHPLAVYALPIINNESLDAFLTNARVAVLTIDTDSEAPDPTMIRDLMGLTLSEARIASLIGTGLPPRQAAEKLGIAEETARSVLKRVFAKVGVSRQSELVSLMTRLTLRAYPALFCLSEMASTACDLPL